MGISSHLSADQRETFTSTLEALQLGLDRLGGARPERRPRWHEVDRLEVKTVRPMVRVGQESALVHVGPRRHPLMLSLLWLERWGGTFGARSSAEANRKRGRSSTDRFFEKLDEADGTAALDPERRADRGQVPAWLLYLACPRCARRCRVLYSRRGQHDYGCPKCERPAAPSNTWKASGAGGPYAERERQRLMHRDAAQRIRTRYLLETAPRTGGILAPARCTLKKPPGMTWIRFEALVRLVEAHEILAMLAAIGHLRSTLDRIAGQPQVVLEGDSRDSDDAARWARTVLRIDAWALRQRSWHRRGLPRDTPGQGSRARQTGAVQTVPQTGHKQPWPVEQQSAAGRNRAD